MQENILQKVVMTAFADRTVVTIAVSPSVFYPVVVTNEAKKKKLLRSAEVCTDRCRYVALFALSSMFIYH